MDPGWKPARKHIWRTIAPWALGRGGGETLAVVRGFWLGMIAMWALFALVLSQLKTDRTARPAWILPMVAGIGALDLALGYRIQAKMRLNLESVESLAASYTQQSVIAWSMAFSPVAWGFVGFFLGGGMSAFLLSIPFGLAGFFLAGPTRRNIERAQATLRFAGSPLSLYEALRRPLRLPLGKAPPSSPLPPPSGPAPG